MKRNELARSVDLTADIVVIRRPESCRLCGKSIRAAERAVTDGHDYFDDMSCLYSWRALIEDVFAHEYLDVLD